MAKPFSDSDREKIRADLMEKGRRLFETYGLKKTSVEDITTAVGISKGGFYNFFQSKEELFHLLIEEEEKFRDEILADLIAKEPSAEQALLTLFRRAFAYVDQSTLMEKLYEPGVFQQLLRKLPPERLADHQSGDRQAATDFIEHFQRISNLRQADPAVIVTLFRAVFLLTLHKNEIGLDVYPQMMELMTEVIATGLTTHEDSADD